MQEPSKQGPSFLSKMNRNRQPQYYNITIVSVTSSKSDLIWRGETSTQYDAMVLLQKIYLRLPEPVNSAILADPRLAQSCFNLLQVCCQGHMIQGNLHSLFTGIQRVSQCCI